MRVLVMNYEWPPLGGGAAPVCRGAALSLAERGHSVDVVTMGFRGLPREETVGERVRVFRVPCLRRSREICRTHEMVSYVLPAFFQARKLHLRAAYDVNHTHFVFPTGLASYLLRRSVNLPYVVSSHGSDVPGYNPERFRLQHRLLKPLWRRIARSAGEITAPSEKLRRLLELNDPDLPLSVLPNGMDSWPPGPDLPRRGILAVSRLFEWKGFQYLIRAIAESGSKEPITIVGEGPYRSSLEELARDTGVDVTFAGWLNRDSEEYRRKFREAALFVFPSSGDSFGMVVLEALMGGVPVLVAEGSAPAEIAGEAGAVFEPGNVGDLARQIRGLMANPERRSRMGDAALARAREFTWQKIGRRLEGILQRVGKEKS